MSRLADDLRDLLDYGLVSSFNTIPISEVDLRRALAVVEAANELESWLDDDDFGMGAKQALAKFRQALEG